ncbi:MAG: hypothetical protein JWN75_880 [Candidatus Saccharibacteria bacterium]|nr:hypothetical protein [Candidatus Saccharibacteria bacterium]
MFQLSILQKSLISFAVLVTFGVLVHDTKVDQATALALTLPVVGLTIGAHMAGVHDSGTDHTHVERASLNNLATGNSRMQVRDDNRRYILVKHISGDKTPDTHNLVLSPVVI